MEMETTMMYKLIAMYMLKQANFALSNAQIVDFFTETGYTNYFVVQQTLSDLLAISFLTEEKHQNTTVYHLTEQGTIALEALIPSLSGAIREDIHRYLDKNRFLIRSEASLRAVALPSENGDYIASLQIKEGDSVLFDLSVSVPSKDEAELACSRFKEQSSELYQMILKALLS